MLGVFVIDEPEWTHARVEAEMEGPHTQHRHLARPVSVYVFYTTAIVRADGALSFFDDVYGEDRDLERALARRP